MKIKNKVTNSVLNLLLRTSLGSDDRICFREVLIPDATGNRHYEPPFGPARQVAYSRFRSGY